MGILGKPSVFEVRSLTCCWDNIVLSPLDPGDGTFLAILASYQE